MTTAQQVWGLPFSERPVLDFEANASSIEIVPCEPGEAPRIESRRVGAELSVTQAGETVKVRFSPDNPWGGNPFDKMNFGRGLERASPTLGEQIIRGIGIARVAFASGKFGGSFTLHVPQNVRARVICNMGEVEIRGLAGCDVGVQMNAGSLFIDECRGRFELRAKAGRILCRRVGGSFDIESGMGEAMLDLVALDEGTHRVISTMGSVKVELAPNMDVKIDSRTVMGSTRTRYPSRSDSKTVLKLEAELGSVRVREGSEYKDPRHGDWPDWKATWKDVAPSPVSQPSSPPPGEDGELRKILDLVQQKKVSPEEAERLISALHGN